MILGLVDLLLGIGLRDLRIGRLVRISMLIVRMIL